MPTTVMHWRYGECCSVYIIDCESVVRGIALWSNKLYDAKRKHNLLNKMAGETLKFMSVILALVPICSLAVGELQMCSF